MKERTQGEAQWLGALATAGMVILLLVAYRSLPLLVLGLLTLTFGLYRLWLERGGRIERHVARAFHTKLTGDFELVVGRDVDALRQFAGIMRVTLFYALAIALVLGLGGGLLMSRNFLRRVDAITEASRTIMAGNMSGRMPVAGSNDELDRLALALNEMLDQIESLMAAMKEVSSNVAHDLKTPLTRIKARAVVEAHVATQRTLHHESIRRSNTFSGEARLRGSAAHRISVEAFHYLRADAHRFAILFVHAVESSRLATLQPGERVAPLNAHGGESLHSNR